MLRVLGTWDGWGSSDELGFSLVIVGGGKVSSSYLGILILAPTLFV